MATLQTATANVYFGIIVSVASAQKVNKLRLMTNRAQIVADSSYLDFVEEGAHSVKLPM